MHFRIALAVLVLDRTRRVGQRGVDDGVLAQLQATVAPGRQLMALQKVTEVEDDGFVEDAL